MGEMNLVDAFTAFGTPTAEESNMAKKVEAYIQKTGVKQVKWARATFALTIIFTILTCLVHFYKADFVNLTVCSIAIYILSNAKDAQPKHFRYLVAGTILSFFYDLVWLWLRGADLAGEDDESGGVEAPVKKFSFVMTIISLIFKVVMTFVFWMASLKFEDIIDERSALL